MIYKTIYILARRKNKKWLFYFYLRAYYILKIRAIKLRKKNMLSQNVI